MTANRRADLQRKLAMKPVEKPPAGLATRLKKDIPTELRFNAELERKRFGRSVQLSMAVAASGCGAKTAGASATTGMGSACFLLAWTTFVWFSATTAGLATGAGGIACGAGRSRSLR